jgi:hypothetical protein
VKHLQVAFACLLLSSGLLAQASRPKPAEIKMWHITPGGKTGAINSQMTEAGLVAIFGRDNVTWGDIGIGEGETEPGTILFASDPRRRLEILWTDNKRRALPKQAQVFGLETSRWETTAGISLGTSLKELERLNGKPFRLYGFDVDYEGTVRSWEGGNLAKELGDLGVVIRLLPSKKTRATADELNTISGYTEFHSDEPAMQKVNPEIFQIVWTFR